MNFCSEIVCYLMKDLVPLQLKDENEKDQDSYTV